jgi:AcrR family transcriptional regulator
MMKKIAQPKAKTKARKGPGRLSAEAAAALPDRLLDAALALFDSQGFADTSMEEIARHAGASTKTLYARHSDKTAVLEAVAQRMIDRNIAEHAASPAGDPGMADPRTYLNALGRRVLTGIGGEGAGLMRMALAEARRIPGLAGMYHATIERAAARLATALTSWQSHGLLPALGDPQKGAALWLAMLADGARIRVALGDPMSKAEIEAHVPYAVDMFLRACGYEG